MGDRKRGDAVNFAPGPAQLPVEVHEKHNLSLLVHMYSIQTRPIPNFCTLTALLVLLEIVPRVYPHIDGVFIFARICATYNQGGDTT